MQPFFIPWCTKSPILRWLSSCTRWMAILINNETRQLKAEKNCVLSRRIDVVRRAINRSVQLLTCHRKWHRAGLQTTFFCVKLHVGLTIWTSLQTTYVPQEMAPSWSTNNVYLCETARWSDHLNVSTARFSSLYIKPIPRFLNFFLKNVSLAFYGISASNPQSICTNPGIDSVKISVIIEFIKICKGNLRLIPPNPQHVVKHELLPISLSWEASRW
jgi:hypothetical protein